MTDLEFAAKYMQVSTAARELKSYTTSIYRELQRGTLDGIVIDGKWMVSRESVARRVASKPTAQPDAAVDGSR